MSEEYLLDAASPEGLYSGTQLSGAGRAAYPNLLRETLRGSTPEWLGDRLPGLFNSHHEYVRLGKIVRATVPLDAPRKLAGGEFNRFYMRGLCRRAQTEGVKGLEIYRALAVADPRPESEAAIGKIVGPTSLLGELREPPNTAKFLHLPGGPTSGISVRYPR
ncbi:MAG TPA: hypothetical protein VHI93_03605 [Candidatus Thermoplasmatota archaeon]|nr:hypothetical protein [Candidatus Thermoplasmatota archaeon]